jgi:hypothetical protein
MKLGRIVWFSSHERPFLVWPEHCLDLECACTDVRLRLTEAAPTGDRLPNPLSFEVQVCLRHWVERDPPRRSAKMTALVRELLAEFPHDCIDELIDIRRKQRASKQRLAEHKLAPSQRGELVCYSDVVHTEGGLGKGNRHYSFFFTHRGRDYLVKDHYCPTPECDCRQVHVELWERNVSEKPRRIDITQLLMATLTLEGELVDVRFSREDSATTSDILEAWRRHSVGLQEELQQRYQQMKAIGQRCFPEPSVTQNKTLHGNSSTPANRVRVTERVGRNAPCPCGSGRKFKRCCARQASK